MRLPGGHFVLILTGAALAGCASVPPATVQLSTSVGNDMLAIKKSHEFYLNAYYARLTYEANRAIDDDYTPALISAAMRGKSGSILMEKLEAGKQGGAAANDAVVFMEEFLKQVKAHVDAQRSAVLGPIEKAHSAALANVGQAYTAVLQGNSTLTAYLESLVKLRQAQDELLAKAGLPNLQDDVAQKLSGASDQVASLLTKARTGEAKIDDVEAQLKQLAGDLQQAEKGR